MAPLHPWLPSPPPSFLCPISLELMTDPVTLETGITYDRPNIEKWLASGHNTCPVTRTELHSDCLVPNCTLLRLIHSWIQSQATKRHQQQQQQQPPPPPPLVRGADRSDSASSGCVDACVISGLVKCICCRQGELGALRQLKNVAAVGGVDARRKIRGAGAVPVLASILSDCVVELRNGSTELTEMCEVAIAVLRLVGCRDDDVGSVLARAGPLDCIAWVLRMGNLEARIDAATVLEELSTQRRLRIVLGNTESLILGLVELLIESLSFRATTSTLNALVALCSTNENRVKAVRAGALSVLVELLLQSEVAVCEKTLAGLELIFFCSEGRAAAAEHPQLITRVVQKISTVSLNASEYAVGVLWELCSFSPFLSAYYDALREGALGKLHQLLRSNCTPRTRNQAKQLMDSLQTAKLLLRRECDQPTETSTTSRNLKHTKGTQMFLHEEGAILSS